MLNGKRIIVVMPAYNTARTIEMAVNGISRDVVDEIIVVDDGSRDATPEIVKKLGVTAICHEKNRGYGAAQKTGYREALQHGGDVMVMVHSDFQYDPTLVPQIVEPIAAGRADACFGSRMTVKKNALKSGMPWWRFIANWALSTLEESVLGLHISEYHTGYRAFSRKALLAIPFEKNSDKYVFDTQMLAQLSMGKFKAAEIPIALRYRKDSQSPNFWQSTKYGFSTLGVMCKYLLHRWGFKSYPQFVIGQKAPVKT